MHADITDLMDGDKRACEHCNKIKESMFFPFKGKPLCLWCYEIVNKRRLHSKRAALGIKDEISGDEINQNKPTKAKKQRNKIIPASIMICPFCRSKRRESKGERNGLKRYKCKECSKNWSTRIS